MLALCLFLAALPAGLDALAAGGGVEVVTNSDHADVTLDRSTLRSLFMMRVRQWPDGAPVRVFVLPDSSDIHDQFCREQLGTYPYVLRSTWDRIVYTGTGLAPTTVNTPEEMLAKVRSTPGAIGYFRRPTQAQAYAQPIRVTIAQGVTLHEK